ncbi:hypothetical protein [Limnobacter sp.]|jgi:hypothetical protein|uniref:hypothetical protein n=1 Tax=Limnobacter sp. TaxID=2003368 RepID=UPI0026CD57E7
MRPPSFNLSLDVPVPSLVRTSHGLPVDPQVLNKQPPAISAALAEILNTPDAGKLLLGLNELFGSASEYAIGGSVALALHHRSITDSTARRPNDLDVVVSPSAMDRLSDLDHQGLSQLGFKSKPGNTESLSWAGQGHESLVVDVVPARNSVAGRGFEYRQMHGGVNVIPLQALVDNLTYRVQSEPLNDRARGDLARGIDLLNVNKARV